MNFDSIDRQLIDEVNGRKHIGFRFSGQTVYNVDNGFYFSLMQFQNGLYQFFIGRTTVDPFGGLFIGTLQTEFDDDFFPAIDLF